MCLTDLNSFISPKTRCSQKDSNFSHYVYNRFLAFYSSIEHSSFSVQASIQLCAQDIVFLVHLLSLIQKNISSHRAWESTKNLWLGRYCRDQHATYIYIANSEIVVHQPKFFSSLLNSRFTPLSTFAALCSSLPGCWPWPASECLRCL